MPSKSDLKKELAEYKRLQTALVKMRKKIENDELPFSLKEKSKAWTTINDGHKLVFESIIGLESMIDDLENE